MPPSPIGPARALYLVARLGCTRFANRFGSRFLPLARRRAPAPSTQTASGRSSAAAPRLATARRHPAASILAGLLSLGFIAGSVVVSQALLWKISNAVDTRIRISAHAHHFLEDQEARWAAAQATGFAEQDRARVHGSVTRAVRTELQHELFGSGSDLAALSEADHQRLDRHLDAFFAIGAAAFRTDEMHLLDSGSQRLFPCSDTRFLRGVAILQSLIFATILFSVLGSANYELGQPEWKFEWLFTLPVRTSVLLGGKLLEYALTSAFSWFMALPFYVALCWGSGMRWGCLPAAVACTFHLNLLIAACRVASETALRKSIAPRRLRNLQGLFSIFGVLLLYNLLYLSIRPETPEFMLNLVDSLPDWFLYAPWAEPGLFLWSDFSLATALSLSTMSTLIVVFVCIAYATLLLRRGLLSSTLSTRGERGSGHEAWAVRLLPRGMIWKEALLLFRDRNYLIQTLVVPLLIVGFQVVIHPDWLAGETDGFAHAAMLAFVVVAYVLLNGGMLVLLGEGNGLWLLYSLPRRLETLVIEKTLWWAGLGFCYAIAILATAVGLAQDAASFTWGPALVACVGVIIFAFIASGLGVLATDPLAQESHRRIRAPMKYTYLFLCALYAYAIYSPSVWQQVVTMVLASLLALAIWQKARDAFPFLLDPTAAPPPAFALSDGLLAALAFFVIQAFILVFLNDSLAEPPTTFQFVCAFLGAGILVVTVSLISFYRRKLPDLAVTLGFRASRAGGKATGTVRVVAYGVLGGFAAAALAIGYVWWLNDFVLFQSALRGMPLTGEFQLGVMIAGWLAAPLEEFIFRGLVFRGLRRSLSFFWSALASAAIFAAVHPPAGALPVFVLGMMTAFGLERTGLIWTPILTHHVIYNGVLLALAAQGM